jgi:hypothetical protein
MTIDQINAATGFANGEQFKSAEDVRAYFTQQNMREMFGAEDGSRYSQAELDAMAEQVIREGFHCRFAMSHSPLSEDFDDSRVIGKTLSELDADTAIDWLGAYPVIEEREAVTLPSGEIRWFNQPTKVAVGIVDANAPETFNGGEWEVVDDLYAVAEAS